MSRRRAAFPVVDIFAGPGGLGEGFSAYARSDGSRPFRIAFSIEQNEDAHATLELRSFYRQFPPGEVPAEYYGHLRGEVTRDELFRQYEKAANAAKADAWRCELGAADEDEVDRRIAAAIDGHDAWALIGGPPCQAYSLAGRSRMRTSNPDKFENDPRHFLYREYLRIIARHRPPVFVMENVKGLLSATHDGSNMFQRIVDDLTEPARGVRGSRGLRYNLHALSVPKQKALLADAYSPDDFVLRAEEYGIPQARHRVIIVGVRDDTRRRPAMLTTTSVRTPLRDVIFDLPRLRSRISREIDSPEKWTDAIRECAAALRKTPTTESLRRYLATLHFDGTANLQAGSDFVFWKRKPKFRSDWYADPELRGVCNHVSRRHLRSDIQRYFFVSAFAASMDEMARSPRLVDFPTFLLPNHENVQEALDGRMFGDRFRVQVAERPSTTVTSHISKDGHYYIHPDPLQARSLTVREAARLQTFPDNYFFCGTKTSQYHQVGNAVPPLLAWEIASVVEGILTGE